MEAPLSVFSDQITLISGNAHPELARSIATELDIPLADAQVGRFPDGEIDIKVNDDLRGRDVFVLQPTCPPVNDNWIELLLLMDTLRRSSAGRITAVMPYYGYARKDRKDEGRVPITAKLVADLITTAGADRVLCMDLHAGQIQGYFNIPVDNLFATRLLLAAIKERVPGDITIISPDAGGVERARAYAKRLGVGLAIIDKRREEANISEVMHIIGDVSGKTCVIVDDIVDTAGTLANAARSLRDSGATGVYAAITHPVLSGPALKRVDESPIDELIVTDTIPLRPEAVESPKIHVVSIADQLGEAIRRINNEESVSSLFV